MRFFPLPRTCFTSHIAFCTVGKLHALFMLGVTVSGLSVEVGIGLLDLYLRWAKSRLVTSTSRLSLVVIPKALGMARLSVVANPCKILPSPSSQFCLLALSWYRSWHPTTSSSSLIVASLLGYTQSWYYTTFLPVVQRLGSM